MSGARSRTAWVVLFTLLASCGGEDVAPDAGPASDASPGSSDALPVNADGSAADGAIEPDASIDPDGALPGDAGDETPPVIQPPPLPEDPTDFAAANDFLFTGPGAIQTGVAPGALPAYRLSVLHGRTLDTSGNPLPGVRATITGHGELGRTLSRLDGRWDLAVPGGGSLVVRFDLAGHATVQRRLESGWHDHQWSADVVLTPLDAAATQVSPRAATEPQVHEASMRSDADGERHPVLAFRPGTTTMMMLPDRTTRALEQFTVRATELTVGEMGPKAMPGDLPGNIAYTFAAELTVDEAQAAGATRVQFDPPVIKYLENFIGFPVGEVIPTGSYDRDIGTWVPEPDGRIIAIVSEAGGEAMVDTDGDGQADSDGGLSIGIDAMERRLLAARHEPGDQLWRVPIAHFSPWDCNWPFGPPDGATFPKKPRKRDRRGEEDPCKKPGSTIHCRDGILVEEIELPGTSDRLHWTSGRSAARIEQDGKLDLTITGPSPHPMLVRVEVALHAWGNVVREVFDAAPDQTWTPELPETDAYGRPVSGRTTARVVIGNVYQAQYESGTRSSGGAAWGALGGQAISGDRAESTITLEQEFEVLIGGAPPPDDAALGGWTLSSHHRFDRAGQVIELGTGDRQPIRLVDAMRPFAFGGTTEPVAGQEVDVRTLSIRDNDRKGILVEPDGTTWFRHGELLIRIQNGRALPFDIGRTCLSECDQLERLPDGRILFTDVYRVLALDPRDGSVTRLAGLETDDSNDATAPVDGVPALQANIAPIRAIAAAPDGTIYVAHRLTEVSSVVISRIELDGQLRHYALDASRYDLPKTDGEPARTAWFPSVSNMELEPDGSLIIAGTDLWNENRGAIVRIGRDGNIKLLAGCTLPQDAQCREQSDDRSVFDTKFNYRLDARDGPTDLEVDALGNILAMAEYTNNNVLLQLDEQAQRWRVVAGGVPLTQESMRDGLPARQSTLRSADWFAVGPDGIITLHNRVGDSGRILRSLDRQVTGRRVPSSDGSVIWEFDERGLHLSTVSAITGRLLREMVYDASGRLIEVRSAEATALTIERDGNGTATAIVAPAGERTVLTMDASGKLTRVETPAGRISQPRYDAMDLLTGFTDAAGGEHTYAYDARIRLISDDGPDGVGATLTYEEDDDQQTVTHTTSGGSITVFRDAALPDGGSILTRTDPDGSVTTAENFVSGDPAVRETTPLRTFESRLAPDPRFGYAAPLLSSLTAVEGNADYLLVSEERFMSGADRFAPDLFTEVLTTLVGSSSITHDRSAGVTSIASSSGRTGAVAYDALGRPVSISLPGVADQLRAYDASGRLTSITEGQSALTIGYTAAGRLQSITDPAGRTIGLEHDLDGELGTIVDRDGRRTTLGRNGKGSLDRVTLDDGTVHQLPRTPGDRVAAYEAPGMVRTTFGYDDHGKLALTTLPGGRTITLTRDDAARVTAIDTAEARTTVVYPMPDDLSPDYEVARTPAGGTADRVTRQFDRARLSRIVFRTGTTLVGQASFTYSTTTRQLTRVTLNGASRSRGYDLAFDQDGLPITIGSLMLARTGPLGAAESISDDRLQQAVRYDDRGNLIGRTTTVNGLPIYRYDVTRDLSGRITGRTDQAGAAAAVTLTYGHDASGRLTSVLRNGGAAEAYGYDRRDNRTSRTIGAGPAQLATYTADDRIITHAGAPAVQDLDGQLTTRGTTTFVHGTRGELLSAVSGATTVTFGYDGLGRRVRRTVGASNWRYLYTNPDHDTQLTAMTDPSNNLWTFLYDDQGVLIAFDRGAGTTVRYYVGTDQLGSPRVVSDRDGNVVLQIEYDAFGRITSESDPAFGMPIGFAGGLREPVTGLVRFGVRDYDPELGRFTTRDPLIFSGGQTNLFTYVRNDPVRLVDPAGAASAEVGICRGICVNTKLAITSDGVSACFGAGGGIGNTVDLNPFGGLDPQTDFGVKGALGISGGPLSASVEVEATSTDCSPTVKPKVCVSVVCLGDALDPKAENAGLGLADLAKIDNALEGLGAPGGKKLGDKGVKLVGSVLAFTCQQLKW